MRVVTTGFAAAALMLACAAAAPAAETLFRADLAIHDATGKRVGAVAAPAVDGSGIASVTLRTGSGKTVIVGVKADRLFSLARPYFTSPDCSGAPLLVRAGGIAAWHQLSKPLTALIGPRHTVWVEAHPRRRYTVQSVLDSGGTCFEASGQISAGRADEVGIDLADYFTAPFSLRATPRSAVSVGPERTPLRTHELAAYDSGGKQLGTGWGNWPGYRFGVSFVTGTGVPIIVTLSGTELVKDWFVYATPDCTGTRHLYLGPFAQFVRPYAAVVGRRSRVWRETGERFAATMQSYGLPGVVCRPTSITGTFAEATAMNLYLDDYFTPPFSLRGGLRLPE